MIDITQYIKTIPNFPKLGIQFKDINPVLDDSQAFSQLISQLSDLGSEWQEPATHVVGMDARGFILGAALALRWGKGFIPVRKPGKLPGEVVRVSYSLEYGESALEMQQGARGKKVVIVDDILATGGTATAAYQLCELSGHIVLGGLFVLDVPSLRSSISLPFLGKVLLEEL